jgi:cellulose synthase/poly-beta-1,6-N-acetylglucosamine synthase-like glycosyltransferase
VPISLLPVEIFFVLALLLALQSAWSLVDGRRFLDLVRRGRRQPPTGYQPFAAVIVPCKGLDPGFELNLTAFLTQDYPAYQLILAVAAEDDPSYRYVRERLGPLPAVPPGRTPKTALVVAGHSDSRGEKVNNLLRALDAVDPAARVLVFADSDVTPGRDWLRCLVAGLEDPSVTVSTGFRWYLPGGSFASQLRAAWDTSIATMLGDHGHNFAWGGSMAIRAAEFKRLQVAEYYWASTVSDDYALTRAVRDARGRIRFEPRCLVKSRDESSFPEFMRWANRQIIITRVYSSHLWRTGLASYALYGATFVLGLVLILGRSTTASERALIAGSLLAILALGVAKAFVRTAVARETFPEERAALKRYGGRYWQLSPLVPWIMLFNFAVSGFVRQIDWRGVRYELRAADEVRVVKR